MFNWLLKNAAIRMFFSLLYPYNTQFKMATVQIAFLIINNTQAITEPVL